MTQTLFRNFRMLDPEPPENGNELRRRVMVTFVGRGIRPYAG